MAMTYIPHSYAKYAYEFIGTFFLVLTVGMTVLEPNAAPFLAPLAIGSVLAALVYATGHVSGAHLNPAVSLAVYLRGRLILRDLIAYWIAQLVAAFIAAYLVIYFKGHVAEITLELTGVRPFLAELLFSFALCFVVLNTATAKSTYGNAYFGLAIGFIVLAGAYAVGTISGAAFNPAVALGISIWEIVAWKDLWMFFIANFVGGALAAAVFRTSHPDEWHGDPTTDRVVESDIVGNRVVGDTRPHVVGTEDRNDANRNRSKSL